MLNPSWLSMSSICSSSCNHEITPLEGTSCLPMHSLAFSDLEMFFSRDGVCRALSLGECGRPCRRHPPLCQSTHTYRGSLNKPGREGKGWWEEDCGCHRCHLTFRERVLHARLVPTASRASSRGVSEQHCGGRRGTRF